MATYPYGTKGGPAVGNSLPGIPKRKDSGSGLPAVIYFDSGSGDYKVPAGYSKIRIAAVGGGGTGTTSGGGAGGGGGGGGLAATNIVSVSEGQVVSYSIGSNPIDGDGTDAVAIFGGYVLRGGGGKAGLSSGSALGGVGTGGDVNYNGGNGGATGTGRAGGGGAAGLGSNGGSGAAAGGSAGQAPSVSSGELAGGGGGASSASASIQGGFGGGSGRSGMPSGSGVNGGLVAESRNAIGTPSIYSSAGTGAGAPGGARGGGAGCVRIELFP